MKSKNTRHLLKLVRELIMKKKAMTIRTRY
jgi:hypothetical protein